MKSQDTVFVVYDFLRKERKLLTLLNNTEHFKAEAIRVDLKMTWTREEYAPLVFEATFYFMKLKNGCSIFVKHPLLLPPDQHKELYAHFAVNDLNLKGMFGKLIRQIWEKLGIESGHRGFRSIGVSYDDISCTKTQFHYDYDACVKMRFPMDRLGDLTLLLGIPQFVIHDEPWSAHIGKRPVKRTAESVG